MFFCDEINIKLKFHCILSP
uniref:Uncharacterized protein n=1 Tax=Amphimedon queenslandica TaxID=400682 RepID=A0A1X7UNF0_AMPQE